MGTIREEMEAAFDELGADGEEETEVEVLPDETPTEELEADDAEAPDAELDQEQAEKAAAARDEKGRFTKAEKAAAKAAKLAAKPAKGSKEGRTPTGEGAQPPKDTPGQGPGRVGAPPSVQTSAKPPVPPVPPVVPEKAPQSWRPAARDKFGTLPPDVQQEVIRREKETAVALQEASESKRFQQAFQGVVGPYEGQIRAEGGDPLRAVGSLLQTASALRTAPGPHKAKLVANIIRQYDVPIEDLDAELGGQPQGQPGQGQPGQAPAPYRDPRVDQLFAHLQTTAEQRQQTMRQNAQQEMAQFASTHEFYEDVRDEMADQIEVAARRGVVLSNEDAYNRACKLNEHVSAAIEQRKASEAAKAKLVSTQRARMAASSVKSTPAGTVSVPQSADSVRAALEASWDEAAG